MRPRKTWIHGKSSAVLGYCFALLVFTLSLGLEHLEDIAGYFGIPINHVLQNAQAVYERLLPLNPRPLSSNYVTLVLLNDKDLPELAANACELRAFMAALLPRVASAHPAVIAVDAAFVASACSPDDRGTQKLIAAVSEVARSVPLVLGLASYTRSEIESSGDGAPVTPGEAGYKQNDLALRDPFLRQRLSLVSWGLIRLNADLERIPITWNVRSPPGSKDDGQFSSIESLSFAAAKAYRRPFGKPTMQLERLKLMHSHPRTNFIAYGDIPAVDALSLVCPTEGPVQALEACRQGLPAPNIESSKGSFDGTVYPSTAELRNRVVLIGWRGGGRDDHETLQGTLPGCVIQANYVEALLDWRYLRPASWWLQAPICLAWLFLFEMIFWQKSLPIWKAALYACALCVMFGFAVYYVAAINFGRYFSLWAPSIIAILLRIIQRILDRVRDNAKRTDQGTSSMRRAYERS